MRDLAQILHALFQVPKSRPAGEHQNGIYLLQPELFARLLFFLALFKFWIHRNSKGEQFFLRNPPLCKQGHKEICRNDNIVDIHFIPHADRRVICIDANAGNLPLQQPRLTDFAHQNTGQHMRADNDIRVILLNIAGKLALLKIRKFKRERFFYALVFLVSPKDHLQRFGPVARNKGIALIHAFSHRPAKICIGIQNAALHLLFFQIGLHCLGGGIMPLPRCDR